MFEKNARFSVTFRTLTVEEKKNMFDAFIEYVTENTTSKIANLFQLANLETTTVDKNANGPATELFEEDTRQHLSYSTKKPVNDVDTFETVVKVLASWAETLETKPSIEMVANFVKFPLYYRNKQFVPPRTYYDLDLVKENDQKIIDEINKLLV